MKKQMIFAAAALILAACSNDETDNWNGEIRLSSALQTQEVQTRGTSQTLQGTQIAADVVVGVFINEENGGTSTTYTQNAQYISNNTGSWKSSPTTYFPQSGAGVDIYAYAPYQSSFTSVDGTYTFTVQPDQSSNEAGAGYLASDLLWGKPAQNPVARTSNKIPLVFSHKLSKVNVTLKSGDGLKADNSDLLNAVVSILNAQTNTSITLNTGALTAITGNDVTKSDITMATIDDNLTASAILPPQSFTQNSQFIKVTLDSGGELYYTLPADITLNEGKVYNYEITVNLTGLSLSSLNIEDWGTDTYPGENGNAYMQ